MCSIFGIKSKNIHILPKYANSLKYRGPDHSGEYSDPNKIYMAHNRLSIIGLDEKSHQPMKSRDSSIIVFNGEIYNYRELKKNELLILNNYLMRQRKN